MKRYTAILLSITLIWNICSLTGCGNKEFVIFDASGEEIVSAHTTTISKMKLEDTGMYSYINQVVDEAITLVSESEKCTREEAKELIVKQEFQIYTSFDKKIYDSIKKSYEAQENPELEFGCAVTDNKGHLLAAYDGGSGEEVNFASHRTQVYSTIKPLSVYAPALEKGIISWSKTYEDSPIKKVKETDGSMRDWPANASNTYSNEQVTVVNAIKKSLNTVAVKCLQEYGVEASIQYLTKNFGINLSSEETKMLIDEEDVLSNIALGYLDTGISPIEMAGYYQSFANAGIYIAPKAVAKICTKEGTVLKDTELQGKRVMNVETAYVMNHLLQEVVSKDGTAAQAMIDDVPVGGKTGTGDQGNWFVGFTPEYSCAVWHGNSLSSNETPKMFKDIVSRFEHDKEAIFPKCGTVDMKAYCLESGMFFSISSGCKRADKGYYTSLDETKKCDAHSSLQNRK